MEIIPLTTVDGFVLFDLDGAEGTGVVRRARKVLRSSAASLARSVTYTFAAFNVRACGVSVGINSEEHSDDLMAAFIDELRPLAESGRIALDAGVGLSPADLQVLDTADTRPDGMSATIDDLTVQGAFAAAAAHGPAATAAIVGDLPIVERARIHAVESGATVDTEGGLQAAVDVLYVAGKTGMIDHELAETINAGMVVPLTPLPVTAKAFAVLGRAGVTYVPDFVSLAAPLLAGRDADSGDPIERVAALSGEIAGHSRGAWWAGVERAETFLHTWRDELPFGRPLA